MGILKLIEWKDASADTIVYRLDIGKDYITRGSKLTVREGQACVFCHKGKMADVFLPGFYTLDTDNVPFLTKLMSWKYGFESPFKSDVFFVNTRQFTNQRWGTKNPIIIRDADYGAVRVRAFGTFAFKVSDAYLFMKELSGTVPSYRTSDISEWLRSMVVTRITDIIGESKIPVLDMAGNLVELGEIVAKQLCVSLADVGIEISAFNFENFSMPEALEKALDESATLGILGKNMDVYLKKAQADALRDAARNPGMAGTAMGAGMGVGMGMQMGQVFGGMAAGAGVAADEKIKCPSCRTEISAKSKFCPECGYAIKTVCPSCGTKFKAGTKFCPECGGKI